MQMRMTLYGMVSMQSVRGGMYYLTVAVEHLHFATYALAITHISTFTSLYSAK